MSTLKCPKCGADMRLKPRDLEDLRRIVADNRNTVEPLDDESWIQGVEERELTTILKRGTDRLQSQIARCTKSAVVLAELANNFEYYKNGVWQEIARNLHTPSDTLEALAPYCPRAVAANPSTSPETLKSLAEKAGSEVAEIVASNPSTQSETLRLLARHPDSEVRKAAERNISLVRAEAALNNSGIGRAVFPKSLEIGLFIVGAGLLVTGVALYFSISERWDWHRFIMEGGTGETFGQNMDRAMAAFAWFSIPGLIITCLTLLLKAKVCPECRTFSQRKEIDRWGSRYEYNTTRTEVTVHRDTNGERLGTSEREIPITATGYAVVITYQCKNCGHISH